jgi:hypothetical protein
LADWIASRKPQMAPSASQDPSVGIGTRSSSSSIVEVTLMVEWEASLSSKTSNSTPAARSMSATDALRVLRHLVSISLTRERTH